MPILSLFTCLQAIDTRLGDASALAKAAMTCAEAGSERQALHIVLDLDALLHEATTLHGALYLIGRLQTKRPEAEPGD